LHKQIGARDEFATALIRALIEKVVVYPRVGADPIAFEIKVSSRLHWISPVKGWLVPRRTPSLSGKLLQSLYIGASRQILYQQLTNSFICSTGNHSFKPNL